MWKPHFPNTCKRLRKTQQPQHRVCPVSPLPLPSGFLFRNHEWLSYPKLFWNSILQILLSIFHLLASDPAKTCASPSTPSSPGCHHWKLISYSTLQNHFQISSWEMKYFWPCTTVFIQRLQNTLQDRHSLPLCKNLTRAAAGEEQQRGGRC